MAQCGVLRQCVILPVSILQKKRPRIAGALCFDECGQCGALT
jgi:hypothetical protein